MIRVFGWILGAVFGVVGIVLAKALAGEISLWRATRKAEKMKDAIVEDIFTRVDKEGIYTENTDMGRVFIFSADKLKTLWEEAENNPTKKLMILVRNAPVDGYV